MTTMLAPLQASNDTDEMVRKYLPLVQHVLQRVRASTGSRIDQDDLYAAGLFGLLQAVENHDPSRGATLKTYAYTRVRGAMLDEIRARDPLTRGQRARVRAVERAAAYFHAELGHTAQPEDLAQTLGVNREEIEEILALSRLETITLEDFETQPSTGPRAEPEPLDRLIHEETVERLAGLIESLPERERTVLRLYYDEEMYMKEIASVLGVTESRVSQIHASALYRLGGMLKSLGI